MLSGVTRSLAQAPAAGRAFSLLRKSMSPWAR